MEWILCDDSYHTAAWKQTESNEKETKYSVKHTK